MDGDRFAMDGCGMASHGVAWRGKVRLFLQHMVIIGRQKTSLARRNWYVKERHDLGWIGMLGIGLASIDMQRTGRHGKGMLWWGYFTKIDCVV